MEENSLYYNEQHDVVSLLHFNAPKLSVADLLWEDEELKRLLSKQEVNPLSNELKKEQTLATFRRSAVNWIRRIHLHYSFSVSTAVLAVNYFDIFLCKIWCQMRSLSPCMSQLAAVACLSIAAKMEETQVPLLLDLQVGESDYVFEAKTIQRMELYVLSALQWNMCLVTAVSFFDHIVRKIGFADMSKGEFVWRCESVLLSVLYEDRFVEYVPSVVAGCVMIHVARSVDSFNAAEYQDNICEILGLDQAIIDSCSSMIMEVTSRCLITREDQQRFGTMPCSPKGVVDATFSSDSSYETVSISPLPPVTPESEPLLKKCKTILE